jgi:bacterioferritin
VVPVRGEPQRGHRRALTPRPPRRSRRNRPETRVGAAGIRATMAGASTPRLRPRARLVTNKKECSMKGDPQVIVHLQAQLKNELTAINQYFVHYRIFKHWGFDKIAKKEYEESIGEMKHADRLMDRILMLDGLPNLQDLGKLLIGENLLECLGCDLKLERAAQATIKDGIAYCESVRDYVSRDILQRILDDTEEHIDFLETQLDVANKVGEQNYLQSAMGELGEE